MKIKVIIIDDHTLFREGLQRLLVRHEIDVVSSVSNGQEGLKSIEDMDPDIILLDLRMPDMSGIEVLKNNDDIVDVSSNQTLSGKIIISDTYT